MALTLKVHRKKTPLLTINKYQCIENEIERIQRVITLKDEEQITITDDPLLIPFDLLFRRQAATPEEKDLSIDRETQR